MVKYFFYAILFLVSTTTQCSKTTVDPNGLPLETQTGAGTFACKINGVVWQWKDPEYQFLDTRPKTRWTFDPNKQEGYIEIVGFIYNNATSYAESQLDLYADSLIYKKEIVSSRTLNHFAMKYYNNNSVKCQSYSSGPLYDTTNNFYSSGKLIISKLDQQYKIISGTFYCTIYQTGCDTLKITEGRFDLKYQ